MTTTELRKVFESYGIGAEVVYKGKKWKIRSLSENEVSIDPNDGGFCMCVPYEVVQLLLTPIPAITDEHAIEVCRRAICPHVTYPANDYKVTKEITEHSSIKVKIDNSHFIEEVRIGVKTGTIWAPTITDPRIDPSIYDFLRAHGYALSDELFNNGIAVRKV